MEKIQKKMDELHALLAKELEDPELHMLLRAAFLAVKKELEALAWAVRQLVVEEISKETSRVNETIDADWANPDKQVDPNAPHDFGVTAEPEPAADEPALD